MKNQHLVLPLGETFLSLVETILCLREAVSFRDETLLLPGEEVLLSRDGAGAGAGAADDGETAKCAKT